MSETVKPRPKRAARKQRLTELAVRRAKPGFGASFSGCEHPFGNLEAALREEPRPGARRKLSGKEEALLVYPITKFVGVARFRQLIEQAEGVSVVNHSAP
jgi:hypothetical protein